MILDGKIIACDRCKEPAISVKGGEVIDLWYSGKATPFSERTSARAITGAQVQNLDHMKRSGVTQPTARSRKA